MSVKRFSGTFGALEQRELAYMAATAVPALHRHLFVVLRVRGGFDPTVRDTIPTLRRWSGMSDTAVKTALADLATRGLIVRGRHRAVGGAPGTAWTWTTTPLRFDQWPPNAAEDQPQEDPSYEQDRPPSVSSSRGGPAAGRGRTSRERQEDQPQEGVGPAAATRDNPDASRVLPEREGTSLIERWVAGREAAGRADFVDAAARGWVADAVDRASRAGCTLRDIEAAIDEKAAVYADPRELDTWAAQLRAQREDEEIEQLRLEEAQARNRELDERAAREDADPAIAAQKAELLAQMRSRGLELPA